MSAYHLVDIPGLWSSSFPRLFRVPKATSPEFGWGLVLFILLTSCSFSPPLHLPSSKHLTVAVTEHIVLDANGKSRISCEIRLHAICTCDDKTGTVETPSRSRSSFAGVKLLNVELGSVWVTVRHVLGPCFVTSNQILDAMNGFALKKVFNPGAAPPKESVDRALAVLLPREVHNDLGSVEVTFRLHLFSKRLLFAVIMTSSIYFSYFLMLFCFERSTTNIKMLLFLGQSVHSACTRRIRQGVYYYLYGVHKGRRPRCWKLKVLGQVVEVEGVGLTTSKVRTTVTNKVEFLNLVPFISGPCDSVHFL